MVFRCIDHLGKKFILEDVPAGDSDDYIRSHCEEFHRIPPDVVILRETLIPLDCPMLVGLDPRRRTLLVPFKKRCMGVFLVEIPAGKKEFELIRQVSAAKCPDDACTDR